ncbi:hypothetical protein HD597_012347 [Nonomuraea thailandensis]|uniref:Uncharacterized protein n=1 Tax=Nonomuraea thailandensis TaxID=1188745 RepID=A0A9X2GX67_9ACTN|nr:hypothetical protein [Nonomuraea thailandensis]MCP2365327.1 hypothetical protein [Nonomuraea thailandensis]
MRSRRVAGPRDPAAKEEYNPYRFNAKSWDNSTGMYDMGFCNPDHAAIPQLTRNRLSERDTLPREADRRQGAMTCSAAGPSTTS